MAQANLHPTYGCDGEGATSERHGGTEPGKMQKRRQNEEKTFRVIIDSQYRVKPGDVVGFDIRPEKLFVFNKETGALI